jgi:hypothetical protein
MKQKLIKPLTKNAEPSAGPDRVQASRDEWEQEVFDSATHFTVTRRTDVGQFQTKTFQTLPDAMRAAVVRVGDKWCRDCKAMLYAVNTEGRSFCIPPKQWLHYLKRWESNHGVSKAG